ncbi:MAG: bifunctional 3-deoxy-7-phosphoheptulonate synthase/chorismate mutase type II [Muribaculaceae bacterium]|nr:bifunctional 3-deoxy-7-phosphoheptulonate synthase/chorismate mutase type II [Muribaculaceae bacterium]
MEKLESIYINGLDPSRPLIIAGPCSAESREQVLETARLLAGGGIKVFRAGIWKPRTRPGGFEGVGEKGLEWLREVKERTGMLVTTEVATRHHVEAALSAGVDLLWIGARTSANPFAIQEIADAIADINTDIPVLVKNPVNPDIELWIGALQRLYNAGIHRLGAIHRGFSTYGRHLYRNLPQWHIPIELRRRIPGLPVIVDPSHMGGRRELVAPLAQQAFDMSFSGLIIESHCDPDSALSDKNQQITPEVLNFILNTLVVRNSNESTESLTLLRHKIDQIDNELVELFNRRMEVSREIGQYKKEHRMSAVQPGRYGDLMVSRIRMAQEMGMSEEFMRSVLTAIHDESVRQQIEVINDRR